jgi:PAS domain S-box-containing protein
VVDDLACLAVLAAESIDAEAHARLISPEQLNGPEYARQLAPLARVAAADPDLKYIYTVRQGPDGARFVLDTGAPYDADGDGVVDQAGLGELYDDCDPFLIKALKSGQTFVTDHPYRDKWGEFFSAYAPVKGPDGRLEAVLGIDMSTRDFQAQTGAMRRALAMGCLVALLASSVVGWGVALYQRSRKTYMTRLAESEHRYALALQGSNDGLWDWDLRRRSVYISERFREMHEEAGRGLPTQYFLPAYKRLVHPADRARVRSALLEHFAGRAPFDIEYRASTSPGSYRWYHARGQVIRDLSGKPVRMAGSVTDVTDRVRLKGQLRRAARQDCRTEPPCSSGCSGPSDAGGTASSSASSSSTSTASRSSTTASATRRATRCSSRSPNA